DFGSLEPAASAGDVHEDTRNPTSEIRHPFLEAVLQRELQLTHAKARASDHPEARAGGNIGVRVVPVRMVREVERFKPELQLMPLGELEVLVHREIETDDAR